jgi:hypothetical protein
MEMIRLKKKFFSAGKSMKCAFAQTLQPAESADGGGLSSRFCAAEQQNVGLI